MTGSETSDGGGNPGLTLGCQHQAVFDLEGLGLLLISLNTALNGPPLDAAALRARLRALGEAEPGTFYWLTRYHEQEGDGPLSRRLDRIIQWLTGMGDDLRRDLGQP